MTILFISDLHLHPTRPYLTQLFLNFLKGEATQAKALYILGDLFDAWIGNDDNNEYHQMLQLALKQLVKQGTQVYFMPGNRDFLVGEEFLNQAGCTLLKDPTFVQIYGVPTVLTHGDYLCLDDKSHQLYRRLTQIKLVQKLFLSLPLRLRLTVVENIRKKSPKYHQNQKNKINSKMDATPTAVQDLMNRYNATLLIHGHTHQPCIEFFSSALKFKQRVVLSDWEMKGNMLVCTSNGQKYLRDFEYTLR